MCNRRGDNRRPIRRPAVQVSDAHLRRKFLKTQPVSGFSNSREFLLPSSESRRGKKH